MVAVGIVVALLLLIQTASGVASALRLGRVERAVIGLAADIRTNTARAVEASGHSADAAEQADRAAAAAARAEAQAAVIGGWVRETRDAAREMAASKRKASPSLSGVGAGPVGGEGPATSR